MLYQKRSRDNCERGKSALFLLHSQKSGPALTKTSPTATSTSTSTLSTHSAGFSCQTGESSPRNLSLLHCSPCDYTSTLSARSRPLKEFLQFRGQRCRRNNGNSPTCTLLVLIIILESKSHNILCTQCMQSIQKQASFNHRFSSLISRKSAPAKR